MAKQASGPRGMYKRGDVWYSRIAGPDGVIVRKRLSRDKQTATLMLGQMRKTFELQKFGVLPEDSSEKISDCASLKRLYIQRLKTLNRRDRTVESFENAWRYIIEDNKITDISQITVTKVNDFVHKLKAKGTRTQTINMYVSAVKRTLKWARDFEYITKNPLARWESLDKEPSVKRRDFTPIEIEKFLAAEEDGLYRLLWLIYFRTGLRATAGLSFEWGWINWDQQSAVLPEAMNKSRIDFWLPLDDDLFQAFKDRKELIGSHRAVGRVFPGLNHRTVGRRFRRNCAKAGIERDGLCLHSIRHTYATMCFEASGNNVKVVQELLCHAKGDTTMRYIHASNDQKRETVNRNALLFRRVDIEETQEA